MRVVMLIQRYYPHIGGAEKQVAILSRYMRSHGIDVQIITRKYKPWLSKYEIVDGIPVYRLPMPSNKALASMLYTISALILIYRLQPDIIHAHELLSPTTTAVLAKRLFHIPIVSTAHRSGSLGDVQKLLNSSLLFGKWRLDLIRKSVDAFVVISNDIKKELDTLGISSKSQIHIPNGVDTTYFSPINPELRLKIRSQLNLYPEAQIVIFCGRLVKEKRVDNLLTVWSRIKAINQNAILLIVGEGDQEADLKKSITNGNGVYFLGPKQDVLLYLQASDIFVLPSIAEGLSVAMLEALSCGLSVLVTHVGSNDEIIKHGQSGLIIYPDDIPALETELLSLLSNSNLRTLLGKNGRDTVMKKYSIKIIASRLIDLYKEVVKKQLT